MTFKEAIEKLTAEQKEELKKVENIADITALLKKFGYDVDLENIKSFLTKTSDEGELDDEELSNVIGGLDIGYWARLLIKKLGEEFFSNSGNTIFGKGGNDDNNIHTL